MQIREQKRSRNARRHFPLPPKSLKKTGDPGMTRTCDLRFRKPSLYPAELRDREPGKVHRYPRIPYQSGGLIASPRSTVPGAKAHVGCCSVFNNSSYSSPSMLEYSISQVAAAVSWYNSA